jgi:hypothetical protein
VRHVLPADQHAPGGGQREAADHAQHGGLARAAGPEQGEKLAGGDRQVNPIHGADCARAVAEGAGNGVELDRGCHLETIVGI